MQKTKQLSCKSGRSTHWYTKLLYKRLGLIQVSVQVASYLATKLLATHSTGSIDYYLCLFMQTQLQLGSYIHACTNETHFIASV